MPHQSGLLSRNGHYYLNMRVPQDLRSAYGKRDIIRKSLGTSDYREAIRLLRFESFKLDQEFTEKRKALKLTEATAKRKLVELSDREAHAIVFRFFSELENETERWWEKTGRKLHRADKDQVVDTFVEDEADYKGGKSDSCPQDGSGDLDMYLLSEGIDCPKGSPAYEKLRPLFRKAKLEDIRRTMDYLHEGSSRTHDNAEQHAGAV